MKGKYKRTQYWCYGCDRAIVSAGMKCSVCGNRDTCTTKIKKPTSRQLILSLENS